MPKGKPFTPIGTILSHWLKSRKWDSKLKQYSLFTQWPDLVGETIARHAVPKIWRGDVLVVEVSNSAWLTELRMMEDDILKKIREACPETKIQKIHWMLE